LWEFELFLLVVFILRFLFLLNNLLGNILSNQFLIIILHALLFLIINLISLNVIIFYLDLLHFIWFFLFLLNLIFVLQHVLVVPFDIFPESHVIEFVNVFSVLNHFADKKFS
jgi:hypothetical protein